MKPLPRGIVIHPRMEPPARHTRFYYGKGFPPVLAVWTSRVSMNILLKSG